MQPAYADVYAARMSYLPDDRMQLHTERIQLHTPLGGSMNTLKPTPVLKLDTRISRSQSRSARSCVAQARVTEEEHRVLLTAARLDGKALGEWAREILLREARRSADDPLFTELIATRMILLNLLKPLAMGQVVTPEDFTRISATVRSDKRKVAQEIQQQYSKATTKEL